MFENCSTLHFIAHTQRDQLGEREVERGRVRKNYFCFCRICLKQSVYSYDVVIVDIWKRIQDFGLAFSS